MSFRVQCENGQRNQSGELMALKKELTEKGTKARQRKDREDRSLIYRDWRREAVSRGQRRQTCYTCDLDQIEYVFIKDEPHPVAILELTRYDHDEHDGTSQQWARYKAAVLDRYFFRDSQGRFVKAVAKGLGIPAYIILFRKDLKSFNIFDMVDPKANWIHKNDDEYRRWLCDLKSNFLEQFNVKHKENE